MAWHASALAILAAGAVGCGRVEPLVDASGGGSARLAAPGTPGPEACGTDCLAFPEGSVVALTPTPATGSVFAGWAGDCTGGGACRVTMDRAHHVIATFGRAGAAAIVAQPARLADTPRTVAPGRQALIVSTAGDGTGRVAAAPAP